MTHYECPTPRAACGVAAVAMSALTFALMIGLPAVGGPDTVPVYAIAAPVAPSAAGPVRTGNRVDCERPDSIQAHSVQPPHEQPS